MIITDIQLAADLLQQGELVAIPTETVYGLAANGFDGNAIAKIYEVKNRPQFNPLILHSSSWEKFASWGLELPDEALNAAHKFSPGPITFVVPKSRKVPDIVSAGHSSVAIRIPNHALTLSLLSKLSFPLAAPSANISGTVSPTQAIHVEMQLGGMIGAILEGGECSIGLESTIISFVNPTKPKLLRLGGLSIEEIEDTLGQKLEKDSLQNNENPQAPGMLSRHYAPKTKLVLDMHHNLEAQVGLEDIVCIRFKQPLAEIPLNNQIILSKTGDLNEAAQKLFAAIRTADDMNKKMILAEIFPDEHLGRAINDRLKRASIG